MKSIWDSASDGQKEMWAIDLKRFIQLHITDVEIYARTNFTKSEDAANALATKKGSWKLIEDAFDMFTKVEDER
jgi:hypothetical protein